MDSKYYYFRDKQNKPRITVRLIKIGNQIARGIAICSALDNPCKQMGRNIAKGRAHKAMLLKKNDCPINRSPAPLLLEPFWTGKLGLYKSVYNPILTKFESKLLERSSTTGTQWEIPLEFDGKIRLQTK